MKILAVCNQKGGAGKTALTVNLAAALAELGESVLVVDMDPQASATSRLGVDVQDQGRAWAQLLLDGSGDLKALATPSVAQGVDVIPSGGFLESTEKQLPSEVGSESVLARLIGQLPQDRWTRILIDTRPSLGHFTLASLVAAHRVLVPVVMSRDAVAGLTRLTEMMAKVQERLNPTLALMGIVACRVQPRPTLDKVMLDWLERHYGGLLFTSQIRDTVLVREAESKRVPVLTHASSHVVSSDFRTLAAELRSREGGK
jgi:chromosome partitioning protein